MVPKYPAARARINRNGSDSSGSEISCDTGVKVSMNTAADVIQRHCGWLTCMEITILTLR